MNAVTIAQSLSQTPGQCLRVQLAPYTLGHELLLLARQSPFLLETRAEFEKRPLSERIFHLTTAVDICSQSWARNQKPYRWMRLLLWRNRRADWDLHADAMRLHIAAGRALMPALSPDIPEDAEAYELANKGEKLEGGRGSGSPLQSSLLLFAIGTLHLPPERAMDTPFALLGNLYLTHLEGKGRAAIENADEADARAKMNQFRAEVQVEKAAATAAWLACTTDEARRAAIEGHPRILDLYHEAATLKGTPCPV